MERIILVLGVGILTLTSHALVLWLFPPSKEELVTFDWRKITFQVELVVWVIVMAGLEKIYTYFSL